MGVYTDLERFSQLYDQVYGGEITEIYGSQQDCLIGKSGSPQRYLAVQNLTKFKQNNTTNITFKNQKI